MAHAGLCDLQVPGDIHGAHHAHLLMENKYGLQIVLPGRMKFHKNLPCLKRLDSPTKAFLLNMEQLMIQTVLLHQLIVGSMLY